VSSSDVLFSQSLRLWSLSELIRCAFFTVATNPLNNLFFLLLLLETELSLSSRGRMTLGVEAIF
jgi:hypothetical protein